MYIFELNELGSNEVLQGNPYWFEKNMPYGYTESESIAREFMKQRNPKYFNVYKGHIDDTDVIHNRYLDIRDFHGSRGTRRLISSLLEYEEVQIIGMGIMKGRSDYMLKGISSTRAYPKISRELLNLGIGSFYEIIHLKYGGDIAVNEINILNDKFGWTFKEGILV